MIDLHEALGIIEQFSASLNPKTLMSPLPDIVGKIAAHDMESPETLPAFTNSAMDGYAVSESYIKGLEGQRDIELKIVGESSAGKPFEKSLDPRKAQACKIMTGAPLPEGADSVIKIEDTSEPRPGVVMVPGGIVLGQNCRYAGEDLNAGDKIIRAGQKMTEGSVLLCSALGITHIPVFDSISIAIIPTGNEIVDYRQKADARQGVIRNSTAPYLKAAAKAQGCHVSLAPPVRDDPATLISHIRKQLEGPAQILITTGGVSAGSYDYIPGIVRDLGGVIQFHKVAIRPGKPVLFATFETPGQPTKMLFGLPGNPVSTVIGFRCFVQAAISAMKGEKHLAMMAVTLQKSCKSHPNFSHFLKGRLSASAEGQLMVTPCKRQGSHQIGDLGTMNCWIYSPQGASGHAEGSSVRVLPKNNNEINLLTL